MIPVANLQSCEVNTSLATVSCHQLTVVSPERYFSGSHRTISVSAVSHYRPSVYVSWTPSRLITISLWPVMRIQIYIYDLSTVEACVEFLLLNVEPQQTESDILTIDNIQFQKQQVLIKQHQN